MIIVKRSLVRFIIQIFIACILATNINVCAMTTSEKITYKVMSETIDLLEKKHNIHSIGTGISGQYRRLELSFEVFRPLEKNEARELLVDCIEEFLKTINSSSEIKPILKEFPFTYKNVSIDLYIKGKNYKKLYHPDICVASFTSTGITFLTDDPDVKYKYKETYEETHEEAFKLVQEYRAQKNRSN